MRKTTDPDERGPMRPAAPGRPALRAVGWLGAVLFLAVGIEAVDVPVASASGPWENRLLPMVWDMGGASGSLDAVVLTPAAAAGLSRTFASVRAAASLHGTGADLPAYTFGLMDAVGRLAGGLVAVVEAPPDAGRQWSLGYTLAGRLGAGAAGARLTWTRVPGQGPGAGDRWDADAGLVRQVGLLLRIGVAAYRLNRKPGARVGLTLSAPSPGGWLVGAGLAQEDLTSAKGQTVEGGLLLPLGRGVQVSAVYRQPLGGGDAGGGSAGAGTWGAGIILDVSALRLELVYRSDGVYQAGLRADL